MDIEPQGRQRLLNLSDLPLNFHGPDADVAEPLPLTQILPVPEPILQGWPRTIEVQCWRLGECNVIITRELAGGALHLSISHRERDPTWNEISQARYRLMPDGAWVAMYLPPRKDYVNVHRFCFQLYQVPDPKHEEQL